MSISVLWLTTRNTVLRDGLLFVLASDCILFCIDLLWAFRLFLPFFLCSFFFFYLVCFVLTWFASDEADPEKKRHSCDDYLMIDDVLDWLFEAFAFVFLFFRFHYCHRAFSFPFSHSTQLYAPWVKPGILFTGVSEIWLFSVMYFRSDCRLIIYLSCVVSCLRVASVGTLWWLIDWWCLYCGLLCMVPFILFWKYFLCSCYIWFISISIFGIYSIPVTKFIFLLRIFFPQYWLDTSASCFVERRTRTVNHD